MINFILVIIGIFQLQLNAQIDREKISINSNWSFQKGSPRDSLAIKLDRKNWTGVTLPHTYNPSGSSEIYRNQKEKVVYEGPAWYKKNLFIKKEWKNKRVFIRFEGSYIDTDVYINGREIGNHQGGYSAFIFEITDDVEYGVDNYISVRVSNEYNPGITPLGGGYVKFGGITRPVSLLIKDKLCISPLHYASTGVYCKQSGVSKKKAELVVETVLNKEKSITGNYEVVCSVLDKNNQLVSKKTKKEKIETQSQWKVSIPFTILKPALWNGKVNPVMYTVKVELFHNGKQVDEVTERTGFRKVYVDKEKGFFLNDKSYPLVGVAQHQYYPGFGSAMHNEHFDEDMKLMLDLGISAIRLSHYPHSEYRYDLLDENGIIASTELAFIKEFFGTEEFIGNCKQQLNEMIYQLYNHPSIAIWGLFNEIRYDKFKGYDGVPLIKELNKIAKNADSSRLTCGVSWKSGERNDVADISGWNRYQGWYWNAYPGLPSDFTWLDQIKKEFPKRKLGITEYGGGGAINHFDENRKVGPYNKDQFHPVDFFNYSHEEHWKEMEKRPWLWGKFIWTLTEFLVPKYDQGRSTFIHDKGLVSAGGADKKDAYYFYKSNWKKDPVFHLAYKNFDIRLESTAEITVYSNLGEVSLSVNGINFGTLKNASYNIYRWASISLEDGDNKIVVTAKKDGKTYKEEVIWHKVANIHNDKRVKEIVSSESTWKTLFKEELQENKGKRGSGVPGEEINASFDSQSDLWMNSNNWQELKLPLITKTQTTKGNWDGKVAHLSKEFSTKKTFKNTYIYLKQTARLSKNNGGRVSIAIDGKAILTIEEGFDDYRLIPITERLGELKKGKHRITVIAKTPLDGGILDVGLVNIK